MSDVSLLVEVLAYENNGNKKQQKLHVPEAKTFRERTLCVSLVSRSLDEPMNQP